MKAWRIGTIGFAVTTVVLWWALVHTNKIEEQPKGNVSLYPIDTNNVRIHLWHNYWNTISPQMDNVLQARGFYYEQIYTTLIDNGVLPEHAEIFAEIPSIECMWDQLLHPDSSSARGLWGFTKARAEEVGLKIVMDKKGAIIYDERMDPFKATQAAAAALLELEHAFDYDPVKVLFAWHGGLGLLTFMSKTYKTTNPWLYQFPRRETMDYAPKVLALTVYMRERNGIKSISDRNQLIQDRTQYKSDSTLREGSAR